MDKTDPKHVTRCATSKELLTHVSDAYHAATTHTINPIGISKLPNGNLIIQVTSEAKKDKLIDATLQWLPRFAPGARLSTQSYAIVVQSVLTDLNLSSASAAIADANPLIPDSAAILGVQWLNDRTGCQPKKLRPHLWSFSTTTNWPTG
jgi:hypothetical protein